MSHTWLVKVPDLLPTQEYFHLFIFLEFCTNVDLYLIFSLLPLQLVVVTVMEQRVTYRHSDHGYCTDEAAIGHRAVAMGTQNDTDTQSW